MISTVIPVLNEVDSLAALWRVGRGGPRSQLAMAGDFCRRWLDRRIVGGNLSPGRGRSAGAGAAARAQFWQAAALSAGVRAAAGELVVTLDADGQDDPAEIPHLIAVLGDRYNLVSGWKQARRIPGTRFGCRAFSTAR